MPQNRAPIKRKSGGQYEKGQSGNPGGRPPGLGKLIRKLTEERAKSGELTRSELVDIWLEIARGTRVVVVGGIEIPPSHKDMLAALEALAKHSYVPESAQAQLEVRVDGEDGGVTIVVNELK